jgi:iron complex outermembrane receptor protein
MIHLRKHQKRKTPRTSVATILFYLCLVRSAAKLGRLTASPPCCRAFLLLGAAMAVLTLNRPVYAQAQSSATPAATETPAAMVDTVEEIVVTAQKRSQTINSVGMSISALNIQQLRNQGIVDIQDLTRVIPSLTFAQSAKGSPVYTIRGVGYNEESLAALPAVSVYVDQIGYSFPIEAKGAPLDLERVEVLKGPQATLYGQSSTGGAINYIAAKPTDTFQAGATASYGRFGRSSFDGFISGPAASTLSMRLAASVDEGGDWQKSFTRNARNGAADLVKGRLLTDWGPTDQLSAEINLNGWRDRSQPPAAALLAFTPQTPRHVVPAARLQQIAPQTPGAADWNPETPQTINENFYQAAAHVEYKVSNAFVITSLSSYEHFDQNDFRDTDGSNVSESAVRQLGKIDSYSQELRASGVAVDDRLNWLLGGFYDHDEVHEDDPFFFPLSSSSNTFIGFGGVPFSQVGTRSDQTLTTKAGFGNVDFAFTPKITGHAGIRYTSSELRFAGCTYDIDGNYAAGLNILLLRLNPAATPIPKGGCGDVLANGTAGLVVNSLNENNKPWRVGLDYKLFDHTLLYANVSKGYKPGSFPNINTPTAASIKPVVQESVQAYEAGFKTDLMNRKMHVDGAIFYYDYKNKQFRGRIPTLFGASETLVNVPASSVLGAELSATWRPIAGLLINSAMTYLDTKVTRDFSNFNPFGAVANFKGEQFPLTPKWSTDLSGTYTWSLTSAIDASIGGNVRYVSSTDSAFGKNAPTSPYPFDLFRIDPCALVDVQAHIDSVDGKRQIGLFGKNVLNRYYWTDVFRQIDNTSRHVGEPATFGVQVSYRY